MTGVPPFAAAGLVTLDNWQDPPFNRWGFQHVRELIPTANIARGSGRPWELRRAERDLDELELRVVAEPCGCPNSSRRPTPTASSYCTGGGW